MNFAHDGASRTTVVGGLEKRTRKGFNEWIGHENEREGLHDNEGGD